MQRILTTGLVMAKASLTKLNDGVKNFVRMKLFKKGYNERPKKARRQRGQSFISGLEKI